MRKLSSLLLVPLVAAATLVTVGAPATADPAKPFPARIALPNGFTPEGLTIGRGTTVYVGSILDGAVWRGDLRTGRGSVLIPGTPGTDKAGLKLDPQGRLWTADFSGGGASVYDAGTGAKLAHYQFTDEPGSYVNDLVITAGRSTSPTRAGRSCTSYRWVRVVACRPPPRSGSSSSPARPRRRTSTTTGSWRCRTGICWSRRCSAVSSCGSTRAPAAAASSTSVATRWSGPTGLVLRGRTLYVIRNLTNVIAVVRMNAGYTAGVVQREITGPQLRSPATGDLLGSALYVVNGRFDVESTPSTDYDIVRVPA